MEDKLSSLIERIQEDPAGYIATLRRLSRSNNTRIRREAATVLEKASYERPKESLAILKVLIDDREELVRQSAIISLRYLIKVVATEILPLLEEKSKSSSWKDREVVCFTLKEIEKEKGREAITILEKLVEDENKYVRRAAQYSLKVIKR